MENNQINGAYKSFDELLSAVLQEVEEQFRGSYDHFAINFIHDEMVLFQIIDRNLLEITKKKGFGYGIYLPFDDSFPETIGEFKRFEGSKLIEQFKLFVLDDIQTYQLDLESNNEHLIVLTKEVLQVIYQADFDMVEIEIMEI